MILALDASTTSTGYAIFDNGVLIDRGVIRPKGGDVKERIKYVYWAIRVLFEKYEYQHVLKMFHFHILSIAVWQKIFFCYRERSILSA